MIDLKKFEILILFSLVIPIIFFGFYPEPLINSMEVSVENLLDVYNTSIKNNLAYKN
jgi:NADH-quinone oxidoreductase subunit M